MSAIHRRGSLMLLSPEVNLEDFIRTARLPEGLRLALEAEAPGESRRTTTLAGALRTSDGRSPLAAALLALDARALLPPDDTPLDLGNLLYRAPPRWGAHSLQEITFSLKVALAFAAGPDAGGRPVVSLAVARWASGRLRIVIGGFGRAPRLALDGPQAGGERYALRAALYEASDEFATAAYRQTQVALLSKEILGDEHPKD